MSASLPPGKPNPSGRNSILGLAAVGVVFLAGVIGVSVWVVKSFVRPKQEVIILPTTAAPLPVPRAVAIAAQANPPSQQVREQLARATIAAAVAEMHPIFTGKVFDAQTHQPVDGVIAMVGYSQGADQPVNYLVSNPRGQPVTPSSGEYRVTGVLEPANSRWHIRVQAHGYEAAESAPQSGSATVDFALKADKDIAGIVYGSDGKPAADVTVGVSLPGGASSIVINNGKLVARSGLQVQSGADGSYSVWPETGDFTIVAASPKAGMAIVTGDEIAKSADIHLSAWGVVQGQVLYGSQPGAGASIDVSAIPDKIAPSSRLFRVLVMETVKADADGHFSIAFVKPGINQIARRVEQYALPKAAQATTVSYIGDVQSSIVTAEAGKTVTAIIGGGGRPVVGKLILPAIPANSQYLINARVLGKLDAPVIAIMPDAIKSGTAQQRAAWLQNFGKTREGRDYLDSHPASTRTPVMYAPEIADDGSFRIEDVHEGTYQLQVTLQVLSNGAGTRTAQGSFTMPPITPELADQPLAIPDIQVQ